MKPHHHSAVTLSFTVKETSRCIVCPITAMSILTHRAVSDAHTHTAAVCRDLAKNLGDDDDDDGEQEEAEGSFCLRSCGAGFTSTG